MSGLRWFAEEALNWLLIAIGVVLGGGLVLLGCVVMVGLLVASAVVAVPLILLARLAR